METNVNNYSQWFPGNDNGVSDALSRDDDRSDEELTNILWHFVLSQVSSLLDIVPLPKRNCLVVNLAAVEDAREGVVTGKTHKDQARTWSGFQQ